MTLTEMLRRVRSLYVDELARTLRETPGAVGEVALRQGTGEISREGALDLGMRIDLMVVEDGQVTQQSHVSAPKQLQFEPLRADLGGVALEIGPFAWDGLRVTLQGASDGWQPLADWFAQWFGDEEPAGPDGLKGVIHFLSDPTPTDDGGVTFEADLGSAPLDAFLTLLDACAATGATQIVLST